MVIITPHACKTVPGSSWVWPGVSFDTLALPQTLSQQPAVITTIPAQSPKRRRKRTPLIVFLLLLSILVAIGAIVSPNLFTSIPGSDPSSSIAFGATGPFVKAPLNASQINAIMHLTGYMKYKQLASLYVSHMSLDEELGQLI